MNFAAVTRICFGIFVDICQSFMPGYRILGGILCDFPRKYRKVLPLSNHWYDAVDLFLVRQCKGEPHVFEHNRIWSKRYISLGSYSHFVCYQCICQHVIQFYHCLFGGAGLRIRIPSENVGIPSFNYGNPIPVVSGSSFYCIGDYCLL